jgi:hypothetical protein
MPGYEALWGLFLELPRNTVHLFPMSCDIHGERILSTDLLPVSRNTGHIDLDNVMAPL